MTRPPHRPLALLLVVLLTTTAFGVQANETLQQFRKYYKTYKDSASRVEAVLALQGIEEPAIANELIPIIKAKDTDAEVLRAIVRVLASFKTRPPIDVLLTSLKTEKDEAIRNGILRAITDGRYADTAASITPCLADKAWEVRRHALQALAAANDPTFAPQIAPLCFDPEPAVRCIAVDSLTQLKSDLVVQPAIRLLQDDVWQVRTSAIAALGRVRNKDAIDPLIARLEKEEGRLVPEIAEALASLTGREFGAHTDKWREWWDQNKSSFKMPPEDAIAYLRGHQEARTGKSRPDYTKSGVVQYHGIDTPSRSIMFVIDCSGSMESLVTEKERFSDGNYPSYSRIDIVKTELQRTIDHLEPFVNFNILQFATDVVPWKHKLVAATVLNKSAAKEWASHLEAIGGSSKEDLAQVGLMASASLDKGKTNTYGALMQALNVNATPKTKDAGKDAGYTTDVDTIFFLSDGRPTVGEFVDPDDILREIKSANELRKVVIHTIAIGEFQKDFMRKIAEQNGGVFVDLGK